MRVAVLSSPRLRYRAATLRANFPAKKSSHPRGLQQLTDRIIGRMVFQGGPCTRATSRDGSYPATPPIGIVTVDRPKGAPRRFLGGRGPAAPRAA